MQKDIDTPSFELKASSFTIPVIYIKSSELDSIGRQLQDKVDGARSFFKNSPLVIDLSQHECDTPLDVPGLIQLLKGMELFPVGLSGVGEHLRDVANVIGLPLLTMSGKEVLLVEDNVTDKTDEPRPVIDSTPVEPETIKDNCKSNGKIYSRIVSNPVRSGQRLKVNGGDLTVTASVGYGAELIADGNIHVYGTLRGRAFAGNNGNEEAMIFCHQLDAELISIAGIYLLNEDILPEHKNCPVQISLQDEGLLINPVATKNI